ncbi:MAG: peroxiredoxin [Hyphomicrobiaceae bacterium]|jgi:peroxiredoxin
MVRTMRLTFANSLPIALLFASLVGAFSIPAIAAAPNPEQQALAQRGQAKLPLFAGSTLNGKEISTGFFAGKRLVVLCFNPGVEQSATFATALANLAPERARHNFEIVGVAMGLETEKARQFAEELDLDFPIFDDSDAAISRGLGLRSPLVLIGVNADGSVGLTMGSMEAGEAQSLRLVEDRLREYLRLPAAGDVPSGELERRPIAPHFEAKALSGTEIFRLADYAGKPMVVVFFLHTCPHCHQALRFFKEALAAIPENVRPILIGISSQDRGALGIKEVLHGENIDFFPILTDSDRSIRNAYGVFAGTPDIVFINADRRIVHRVQGWNEDHDPNLARMHLAKMAGLPVPMLLDRNGFSGNDTCAVCHQAQTATWEFTNHATAFNSLVPLGKDEDPACVGCHVVGFEKPGGYSLAESQRHLENVGCESCHGAAGGHLDSKPKPQTSPQPADYQNACLQCHTPTHSMGFDYASFVTKVSHTAIATLSPSQRMSVLAERGAIRHLLPTGSAIVGSRACRGCHDQEYKTWTRSRHAQSMETLAKRRKDRDPDCQRCHVTGFERPGGFKKEVWFKDQADLARVGCESCHGPGGEHVKEGAVRTGNIVRLGDKCDSCVILQICGTCHDHANDPEFRFKIEERIDAQRHGTP